MKFNTFLICGHKLKKNAFYSVSSSEVSLCTIRLTKRLKMWNILQQATASGMSEQNEPPHTHTHARTAEALFWKLLIVLYPEQSVTVSMTSHAASCDYYVIVGHFWTKQISRWPAGSRRSVSQLWKSLFRGSLVFVFSSLSLHICNVNSPCYM